MSVINQINVNSTDYDISVSGSNVTSTGATSGQVLTADGSGGTSFTSLSNHATFTLSGTTLTITNS